MLPTGVVLPDLASPYGTALAACVEAMFARYDVVAVVACGTVLQGTPDKGSDLDIYVLHRGTFRQRVQLFFHGVPCEIFVNPPSRIPTYFEEERKARRPISAHMFATGVVVYDPEGVAADLARQARVALFNLPQGPDDQALAQLRYCPATMFEDAEDLLERDQEGALLLLGNAVYALVQCRFAAEPGWIPRQKDFMPTLRRLDPEIAKLVAASGSGDIAGRFDAARQLCIRVTGASGFFEWASEPEA